MNRTINVRTLCATALLIAIGIVIPMYSPIKFVIPPVASYTLASHVPIFIAMFISPGAAVAVTLGTTLGFYLGIGNLVIVARAASHIAFALLGSVYLTTMPVSINSHWRLRVFSLVMAFVHAAMEVAAVTIFYAAGMMPNMEAYQQVGFFYSVFLLVGLGTIVHSMVDFELSLLIMRVLRRQRGFSGMLTGFVR